MGPEVQFPLPSADMVVAMASIVLTFLVGATVLLLKRSLEQIDKIAERLNIHEVKIEVHTVRLDDHKTRIELIEHRP